MRWWHWALLGAAVAASLVAEQVDPSPHHYFFSGIPGFFVLFGFAGCVLIIVLSKWYGKRVVQRPEDYYDRHGDADVHLARTGVADPGAGEDDGAGREEDAGPSGRAER